MFYLPLVEAPFSSIEPFNCFCRLVLFCHVRVGLDPDNLRAFHCPSVFYHTTDFTHTVFIRYLEL